MSAFLERSSRANMHYKSCAVSARGRAKRRNAEIVRVYRMSEGNDEFGHRVHRQSDRSS